MEKCSTCGKWKWFFSHDWEMVDWEWYCAAHVEGARRELERKKTEAQRRLQLEREEVARKKTVAAQLKQEEEDFPNVLAGIRGMTPTQLVETLKKYAEDPRAHYHPVEAVAEIENQLAAAGPFVVRELTDAYAETPSFEMKVVIARLLHRFKESDEAVEFLHYLVKNPILPEVAAAAKASLAKMSGVCARCGSRLRVAAEGAEPVVAAPENAAAFQNESAAVATEVAEAPARIAYACRHCMAFVCKTCAETRGCRSCGRNEFEMV